MLKSKIIYNIIESEFQKDIDDFLASVTSNASIQYRPLRPGDETHYTALIIYQVEEEEEK